MTLYVREIVCFVCSNLMYALENLQTRTKLHANKQRRKNTRERVEREEEEEQEYRKRTKKNQWISSL